MPSPTLDLPVRIPGFAAHVMTREFAVIVQMSGEVDLRTREAFERGLDQAVRATWPGQNLVIDLGAIEFFGSSGLAGLLATRDVAEEQGILLRVVAPQRVVRRPMEVTGLFPMLRLYDTVQAALDASARDDPVVC